MPGAEYGRAVGAVVVVTSKSGSNEFHGSLFEFLRNDKLDARNFFARADGPKPPYKLNQFGASLGGPVMLPSTTERPHLLLRELRRLPRSVRRHTDRVHCADWRRCARAIFGESRPTGFSIR